MKKIFTTIMILSLLLMPLAVYAQTNQASQEAPPVSQALVPEGDFALKLAPALGLGTPNSEAQAEDMLTSAGIAPKNGWIADYPITPIVIGELQNAVTGAADTHKLPMGKDDALTAFHNVTVEFGLAVVPGSPGQYAENQPQPDSAMIDNYYSEEGPPVVTYYPPPWDYSYLYAWVPYPFWWGGFFFSGFFCLHDFHGFHHNHLISNHFVVAGTHTVAVVDPVSHTAASVSHTAGPVSRTVSFSSTTTRNSAASIFNRSANSTGGSGTFSRTTNSPTGSGMNLRSSQSTGRSSGSSSSAGSFSCANCHGSGGSFGRGSSGTGSGGFSGGRSSGGFSGSHSSGSFSGSHSSGGFSSGHSFGGFSGGGFSGGHGGGGHR